MTRLRRLLLTAAVALAGAFATAAPAPAATDGTSNTVITAAFGSAPVTSLEPGASPNQVVVTLSNSPSGLVAGKRYEEITFSSSGYLTIDLRDVIVSQLTGTGSGSVRSYALSFTAIEFKNTGMLVERPDLADPAWAAFAAGGQEGEE
jgi:hypothetical protein